MQRYNPFGVSMPLIVFYYPDRITEVKTDIYVTSFGPVSDTDMVRTPTGHLFIVLNYSPTCPAAEIKDTTPEQHRFGRPCAPCSHIQEEKMPLLPNFW